MRAINRKLLRDLWRIRSQALAIGLVIAAGVAIHVLLMSAYASLQLTQAAYYERYRFAHVFASLERAPLSVAREVTGWPGVAGVEARVVAEVTLDVPDNTAPVSGRLMSLPEEGVPAVNDVFIASGRRPTPGRDAEVLVSEQFAQANDLDPGDELGAVINGRRRTLRVVGLALSPEFVYTIRPGELVGDNERFGVLWMNGRALASAFQMEGGFNDLVIRLAPGVSTEAVVDRVDRLLDTYGGLGAMPRSQQLSHFFLQSEIDSLEGMGRIVPVVFLAVAAFLINVVLTRLVAVEREQVAALKAIGYSNAAVGRHYLEWGLIVAAFGGVAGTVAGAMLGRGMLTLYAEFFHFPLLEYRLTPAVMLQGAAVAFVAAAVGTIGAVRRVVLLPPAEAMRPEAPARYRVGWIERGAAGRLLSPPMRMLLRNMRRRPLRAAMSTVAIAASGALLIVGLFSLDSVDVVLDVQFTQAQRYDALVTFFHPVSASAAHEVARLPGVVVAEGFRSVPVRLRAGSHTRYVAITGVGPDDSLNRVIDESGHAVRPPPEGLVLSRKLGELLDTRAGDQVRLEVLEGTRPVREVAVVQLVDDYMGLNAYMDRGALHRLLQEDELLSGAYLLLDPTQHEALYATIHRTPAVAGLALKQTMLDNFQEQLDESVGIMRTATIVFAAIIVFGVVYNTARVALSERGRELATLRVIGMTRGEISRILFGEWAIVTAAALPLAAVIGYGLAALLVDAFSTEVYRLPLVISGRTYAWSLLTVVLAATVSGLAVRRRLHNLDLIAVLKTRE
jgi:putative ABC transport system permease protein